LKDAVYEKIVVPASSELIFSDAPINLKVKAIKVDGHLRIGSPTCRIYSDITITLYGPKTTANTIDDTMGSKGIGVDGKIDIHGKQFHHSWTRLAATVWPGDSHIWIQEDVNWEVGQRVVVVTTDLRDEETMENEVMTIKAIHGRTIEFLEIFKHVHYGGPEYQAEVGLLSRRIVIQGDSESENDNFGGHIMVRGEGRFSGVRAYRMGQTNQLARYPFHFHGPTTLINSSIQKRTLAMLELYSGVASSKSSVTNHMIAFWAHDCSKAFWTRLSLALLLQTLRGWFYPIESPLDSSSTIPESKR
jgi:hypothetical protein